MALRQLRAHRMSGPHDHDVHRLLAEHVAMQAGAALTFAVAAGLDPASHLRFGRIVVSEIEAPNMLVNLV